MRPSDEGAVRPVIASNGVPYLQMKSVDCTAHKNVKYAFSVSFANDLQLLHRPWFNVCGVGGGL